MHAREVSRKRSKVLPFKGERKVHGIMKLVTVCCEIGSGRERKHYTCSEVVEVEPIRQKG